jgi:hypothetical protein
MRKMSVILWAKSITPLLFIRAGSLWKRTSFSVSSIMRIPATGIFGFKGTPYMRCPAPVLYTVIKKRDMSADGDRYKRLREKFGMEAFDGSETFDRHVGLLKLELVGVIAEALEEGLEVDRDKAAQLKGIREALEVITRQLSRMNRA